MSTENEKDAAEAPESVFGNLPTTRPGARSPRREAEPPAASDKPKPDAEPASAEPPPPPPSRPEPSAGDDPAEKDDQGGGIEEVAWAGVAAAAEAATIGVRMATRALEAVRDAVDRR